MPSTTTFPQTARLKETTELKKFLDDIQDYSVEHFLINNSESFSQIHL